MKKIYTKPSSKAITVDLRRIICQSGRLQYSGNYTTGSTNDDNLFDEEFDAKERSAIWDD